MSYQLANIGLVRPWWTTISQNDRNNR